MTKCIINDISFPFRKHKVQCWFKSEWNRVVRSTFRFQGTYLIMGENTKNHREILFFLVFAIPPDQRKSISIKPLLFMECLWWARSLGHYLETPKELWEASIRIPAWPLRILEFRDASWLTKGHSMNGCLSLDLSPVLSPKFLHSQCYTHSSVNMTQRVQRSLIILVM